MNSTYPPSNATSYSVLEIVIMVTSVSAVWILVVIGNGMVIAAIMLDRGLKGVQNWFLASLGFADFLLGFLVLPLSLTKEILGYWIFGRILCSLWLAIDVLLCTASIMNLCLISLDRYWSIAHPLTYTVSRTPRRACLMIMAVWLLSAVICLPPLLGWSKPQSSEYQCELTNDIGYVFYSVTGSFYIPLTIIIVVYAKVFVEARRRLRNRPGVSDQKTMKPAANVSSSYQLTTAQEITFTSKANNNSKDLVVPTLVINPATPQETPHHSLTNEDINCAVIMSAVSNQEQQQPIIALQSDVENNDLSSAPDAPSCSFQLEENHTVSLSPHPNPPQRFKLNCFKRHRQRNNSPDSNHFLKDNHNNNNNDQKSESVQNRVLSMEERKRRKMKNRERRATVVLGVILGAFIICWFPFFTTYITDILCQGCVSKILFGFFFWMGYCNSALNPIIYTVFNRDFRRAFHRLLTCQRH